MFRQIGWLVVYLLLCTICKKAYCQQDVDFHLSAHLLTGKKIIKVKRDYYDPYLWVLAQNNQVYRINSLSLAIDDYTATFAAQASLQFTDIAGLSQDTVFIGTNSSNIIEYKKGIIKTIGSPDGISGMINQVGIDHLYNEQPNCFCDEGDNSPLLGRKLLIIATTANMYYYDCVNEAISLFTTLYVGLPMDNRLFETTYRTEAYSNLALRGIYDPNYQYAVTSRTSFTIWDGVLTYNTPPYGAPINTFYYITGNITSVNSGIEYDNSQYLNQLWGTDNGLFENTFFGSNDTSSVHTHYLSGIKVNKVTSIYGLAVFPALTKEHLLAGTDNGLYFSSSGYHNYNGVLDVHNTFTFDADIGNQPVNDICVDAASYLHATAICENAAWIATNNGLYLIKSDYSSYINTASIKAISFKNEPDTLSTLNLCSLSSTTAKINLGVYSGANIDWYRNGAALPGENSDTLNIRAVGDYYAILHDPCENINITTNHLKVNLISDPVFTFNYPDKLPVCDSTSVKLNVTYSPSYHYRWYHNDTLNSDTTSFLIVTQPGKYKVEVSACSNSWVPSKEVQVSFNHIPTPAIKPDKLAYCLGDQATLSVNIPVDPSYNITWLRDGNPVDSYNNLTAITTSIPGTYTVLISSTATGCSQTSLPVQIGFIPTPAINILKNVNTTLCQGKGVSLQAIYKNGTVRWSTGETTDQITVSTAGIYKVTLTSTAGCIADTSITISFLPLPVFNVNDTTICPYKHQPVTLTAPAGFSNYLWNNQQTTQTFTVTTPQTVSLTVTDANGCQASLQIHVIEQCPEVEIPNAFTPNGDGINDTWVIDGVNTDPTVTVKVFNRYGTLIYKSNGYKTPWNGEYNGGKLPAGVYYYILKAKDGKQTFSGSVTILY